jgi:hypothetical protein
MKGLTRVAGIGMIFLLAGAGAGYAEGDELALDCADYVSSGAHDEPLTGHLIGTEGVLDSKASSASGNAAVGGGAVPATVSAGMGLNETRSVTYEVGYYQMSDGRILRIDCRTYSVAQ